MKKIILMCVAGILLITTVVGGSIASFTANTDGSNASTVISTKNVSVKLNTDSLPIDGEYNNQNFILPGEIIKLDFPYSVTVLDGSYDAYIKVTVNKSWFDNDKKVNLDADNIIFWYDDHSEIKPSENWIISKVDSQQTVLYYTLPVSAGNVTEPFLSEFKLSHTLSNEYAGKQVKIDVEVDAVQIIAGVDAIKSAWGVVATINQDKVITKIAD